MKQLFFYALLGAMATGCHCKDDTLTSASGINPACLAAKIADVLPNSCNDIRVDAFDFQGQRVYVLVSGTCGADMADEVFNSQCNSLGYLGGFCGNTVINGDDWANATFVNTIWRR